MFSKYYKAIMQRLDEHQAAHAANLAQLAAVHERLATLLDETQVLHERISFINRPRLEGKEKK